MSDPTVVNTNFSIKNFFLPHFILVGIMLLLYTYQLYDISSNIDFLNKPVEKAIVNPGIYLYELAITILLSLIILGRQLYSSYKVEDMISPIWIIILLGILSYLILIPHFFLLSFGNLPEYSGSKYFDDHAYQAHNIRGMYQVSMISALVISIIIAIMLISLILQIDSAIQHQLSRIFDQWGTKLANRFSSVPHEMWILIGLVSILTAITSFSVAIFIFYVTSYTVEGLPLGLFFTILSLATFLFSMASFKANKSVEIDKKRATFLFLVAVVILIIIGFIGAYLILILFN